ncbi:MAG: FecR family protein [Methylococcaceae bacterium]|jgi:transmembrane sensor
MVSKPEDTGQSLTEQAIDWLVIMRSGSVDAGTQREFEHWLRADSTHTEAYAKAQALWEVTTKAMALASAEKPLKPAVYAKPLALFSKPYRIAWLATAATLTFGLWMAWASVSVSLFSDYSTTVGQQKQVTLADGSRVFLNTKTAISLQWDEHQRRIILHNGQAAFTVAKDVNRPFVVETKAASVRALGTVFEVFEQDAGAFDVAVTEHAIDVSLKANNHANPVRVGEAEMLHYSGTGELQHPELTNPSQITAWQRGKVIFKDQPLDKVIAELNRYSKTWIVLKGNDIKQRRVSGVFPIDNSTILTALEKVFAIHATRVGPWLIILHT